MITLRKARKEDALTIAKLAMLAMADIVYEFIGEKNEDKAISFLTELAEMENNQYSFENVTIFEYENILAGFCITYDGANLVTLRKPVLDLLQKKYNQKINPQDETEAGEIYIDCIATFPEFRGKGIGNFILDHLIEEIGNKHNKTLGLLVDFTNPRAQKLYESKGFKVVGEKTLMKENHFHMQIKKGS